MYEQLITHGLFVLAMINLMDKCPNFMSTHPCVSRHFQQGEGPRRGLLQALWNLAKPHWLPIGPHSALLSPDTRQLSASLWGSSLPSIPHHPCHRVSCTTPPRPDPPIAHHSCNGNQNSDLHVEKNKCKCKNCEVRIEFDVNISWNSLLLNSWPLCSSLYCCTCSTNSVTDKRRTKDRTEQCLFLLLY